MNGPEQTRTRKHDRPSQDNERTGGTHLDVSEVAQFQCCITCVHRAPYPASMKTGQPVFYRFLCRRAFDSNKGLVRPEDSCPFWGGASLGVE